MIQELHWLACPVLLLQILPGTWQMTSWPWWVNKTKINSFLYLNVKLFESVWFRTAICEKWSSSLVSPLGSLSQLVVEVSLVVSPSGGDRWQPSPPHWALEHQSSRVTCQTVFRELDKDPGTLRRILEMSICKSLSPTVSFTDVSHEALYQEEGSVNHVQSVFEIPRVPPSCVSSP